MSSTAVPIPPRIRDVLAAGSVVTANVLADWLREESLSIEQALCILLPIAAQRARAPVSGYHVGAVALGLPPADGAGPGAIYLGANLEFTGPLGLAVHAEQAAVNNAWLHGETGLQTLAVTAAPCGHCRQFLWELSTAADLRILIAPSAGHSLGPSIHCLPELLPRAFGPHDLGLAGGLMSPTIQQYERTSEVLVDHAIAAAEQSYAPYSGNFAGVALQMSDGRIIKGRGAENAAFNPSLPPLQSALSMLALEPASSVPVRIERAVLAEVPSLISQRTATEALLRLIEPRATFAHRVVTSRH